MPGPITILPLISAPPKYGEDLLTSYVGIHVEEIALTTETHIQRNLALYSMHKICNTFNNMEQ